MSTAGENVEPHRLSPTLPLRVSNLSFTYDDHSSWRMERVSLEIKTGLSNAIFGENGSGKTMLLHLPAGLLEPVSGEISLPAGNLADNRRSWQRQWIAIARALYKQPDILLFDEM